VTEARHRLRRARASVILLLAAVLLSVVAYAWVVPFDPRPWAGLVIAAGPLVVLGLPAWLMLWATIRRGDPYDRHGY
jgi:hypothetical protein